MVFLQKSTSELLFYIQLSHVCTFISFAYNDRESAKPILWIQVNEQMHKNNSNTKCNTKCYFNYFECSKTLYTVISKYSKFPAWNWARIFIFTFDDIIHDYAIFILFMPFFCKHKRKKWYLTLHKGKRM